MAVLREAFAHHFLAISFWSVAIAIWAFWIVRNIRMAETLRSRHNVAVRVSIYGLTVSDAARRQSPDLDVELKSFGQRERLLNFVSVIAGMISILALPAVARCVELLD